jgi:hypothetical protein
MLNLYKSSCVLRSGRSFSISGSLAVDEVPVEVGLPVEVEYPAEVVALNRTKFFDGKNRSKFVKIGRIWPKSEKFGEIRFFVRIVEKAELRFEPKTVKPRPQIEVFKSIVILAYVFSNKQITVFTYYLYKMVTTFMKQQFCSVVSNK